MSAQTRPQRSKGGAGSPLAPDPNPERSEGKGSAQIIPHFAVQQAQHEENHGDFPKKAVNFEGLTNLWLQWSRLLDKAPCGQGGL